MASHPKLAFDFTGEVAIVTGAGSRMAGLYFRPPHWAILNFLTLLRWNWKRKGDSNSFGSSRGQSGTSRLQCWMGNGDKKNDRRGGRYFRSHPDGCHERRIVQERCCQDSRTLWNGSYPCQYWWEFASPFPHVTWHLGAVLKETNSWRRGCDGRCYEDRSRCLGSWLPNQRHKHGSDGPPYYPRDAEEWTRSNCQHVFRQWS